MWPSFQRIATRGMPECPIRDKDFWEIIGDQLKWKDLDVCNTGDGAGDGLYVLRPFQQNSIICDYYGPESVKKTLVAGSNREVASEDGMYEMNYYDRLQKSWVMVNPRDDFVYGKYANHSPHPNAVLQLIILKKSVTKGQAKVVVPVLKANRLIQAGEEVLWDYKNKFKQPFSDKCRCITSDVCVKARGGYVGPPYVSLPFLCYIAVCMLVMYAFCA